MNLNHLFWYFCLSLFYILFCCNFVYIQFDHIVFFLFFALCRNGARFAWPCRNNEKQNRSWVSLSSWHRSHPPPPWTRCPVGEEWSGEASRPVATCQWPRLSPTSQLHPPHLHYHCPSSNIDNNIQSSRSSNNSSRITARPLPLSMQATWTLRATQRRVVVQSRPAPMRPYLRFHWLRMGRIQARRSWTTSCKWLCPPYHQPSNNIYCSFTPNQLLPFTRFFLPSLKIPPSLRINTSVKKFINNHDNSNKYL